MSRFLLDTNILSALVRPVPPAPLVTWMRKQIASSLYISSVNAAAGLAWARLMAAGKATGRPRSGFDMLIAAIAEVSGCVVVTTNERHFVGLSYLNPAGDVP